MNGFLSFFGKVFGTEAALEASVAAVANGLDKLVHTSEEKAEENAKERTEARAMVIEWMKATQGQNLARRFFAFIITSVWALHHITGTAVGVLAVWSSNPDRWLATAKVFKDGGADVNAAFMLILAFYFAAPHMGDIVKAVSGKFTKSMNRG